MLTRCRRHERFAHRPGMIDIATVLVAPPPWNAVAAEQQIVWMLQVGAAWWNCFASLTGSPEVNRSPPAKPERYVPSKVTLSDRSG